MEVKNLDKFRGKMKRTTVTEDRRVTISVGSKKYTGIIRHSVDKGYCIDIDGYANAKPFDLAGVEKVSFTESVLGYTDKEGTWPWMKSTDDILKVLVELDRLYKEPNTELPKSIVMEPKYKVGDRVVIARRVPGKKYGIHFLDSMAERSGTISAVAIVNTEGSCNSYKLTTIDYWWSEDMLEPFDPDPHPKYLDFIPKKEHYSLNFKI